jgi:hypothetical protein
MLVEYSVIWKKAFDYVNHEVLLTKLHFLAFKEQQQVGSDPKLIFI